MTNLHHFTVQALVAQLAVEGLAVAVSLAAGRNVECLRTQLCEPVAYDLGRHLLAPLLDECAPGTSGERHVDHGVNDAEAVVGRKAGDLAV